MAGYDIEIIRLLIDSSVGVVCCGDNKQATFSTHNARKNKKRTGKNIWEFFKELEDKNMVEECLCDSTAVIQTMDVASKTEKLSHLEAGIAMVVALMNQFTISVIQDTIKFSRDISYRA